MKLFTYLSIIFILSSCSGYRLAKRRNPFFKYGVKSTAVPMFVNYSNIGGVAGMFTKEFVDLMHQMRGLEVKNYKDGIDVDSYLVGIIESSRFRSESVAVQTPIEAKSVAPDNVGGRNFNIPATGVLQLKLKIYLIRSGEGVSRWLSVYKKRRKNFPNISGKDSSIILQREFDINVGFEREIYDGEATVVNKTQNSSIVNKVLAIEAKKTAQRFQDTILYAF
jgi:hypothetical protein